MPATTLEAMRAAVREAGLEKAGQDVLFPWGFKIAEVNGKKYLQACTPEEYKKAVLADTGKAPSEEQVRNPWCTLSMGGCVPTGCHGTCELAFAGTWSCLCRTS